MTDTDANAPVTGVAAPPAPEAAPAKPRRVIGGDAEAALLERAAKQGAEEIAYTLRGTEYRLLVPTPAPALLYAAQMGNDLGKILDGIRACFHPDDAEAFIEELMRTDVDHPVDTQFLVELLNVILEATTSRPTSS